MKKLLSLILALSLMMTSFVACSTDADEETETDTEIETEAEDDVQDETEVEADDETDDETETETETETEDETEEDASVEYTMEELGEAILVFDDYDPLGEYNCNILNGYVAFGTIWPDELYILAEEMVLYANAMDEQALFISVPNVYTSYEDASDGTEIDPDDITDVIAIYVEPEDEEDESFDIYRTDMYDVELLANYNGYNYYYAVLVDIEATGLSEESQADVEAVLELNDDIRAKCFIFHLDEDIFVF